MNKQFYLELVAATDKNVVNPAEVLNTIRYDANADAELHSTDREEIATAINKRFSTLNAEVVASRKTKRPALVTRKILPMLFIFAVCFSQGVSAVHAQGSGLGASRCELIRDPACLSGTLQGFGRRLAALSMIESGDDDNAVGKAGEVSRYQILPSVWREYASSNGVVLDPRNTLTAQNVAAMIMATRVAAFVAKFGRQPSDEEIYIIWARPSWLLSGDRSHSISTSLMTARALRFANLVNR